MDIWSLIALLLLAALGGYWLHSLRFLELAREAGRPVTGKICSSLMTPSPAPGSPSRATTADAADFAARIVSNSVRPATAGWKDTSSCSVTGSNRSRWNRIRSCSEGAQGHAKPRPRHRPFEAAMTARYSAGKPKRNSILSMSPAPAMSCSRWRRSHAAPQKATKAMPNGTASL